MQEGLQIAVACAFRNVGGSSRPLAWICVVVLCDACMSYIEPEPAPARSSSHAAGKKEQKAKASAALVAFALRSSEEPFRQFHQETKVPLVRGFTETLNLAPSRVPLELLRFEGPSAQ